MQLFSIFLTFILFPIYLSIWEEKNYIILRKNKMQTQEPNPSGITNAIEKKLSHGKCVGIYGLRNKLNNRWYIGQSWNIYKRWGDYRKLRCDGQVKLYNALLKYGYDGFERTIIEICQPHVSQDILDKKEIAWIKYYKGVTEGYNLSEGGSGGFKCAQKRFMVLIKNDVPFQKKFSDIMKQFDHKGEKCPSYGMMWINNGVINRKIKKDARMIDGFSKGRLGGNLFTNNRYKTKNLNR